MINLKFLKKILFCFLIVIIFISINNCVKKPDDTIEKRMPENEFNPNAKIFSDTELEMYNQDKNKLAVDTETIKTKARAEFSQLEKEHTEKYNNQENNTERGHNIKQMPSENIDKKNSTVSGKNK